MSVSSFLTSLLGKAQDAASKAQQIASTYSNAAAHAPAKITQSITTTLTHDTGSDIDSFSSYISELKTPNKKFFSTSTAITALSKEKATLADFRNKINSILEKGPELFHVDFSQPNHFEHAQPFKDLIDQLDREIGEQPDNSGKEVSKETLDALDVALTKLHFLKTHQAGFISKTALLAQSQKLNEALHHLTQLQQAFENNADDISHTLPLDPLIDSLLKSKNDIFYSPKLSVANETLLKQFQTLFRAYNNLPNSLKQDTRFQANQTELTIALHALKTLTESYISSQKGYGQEAFSAGVNFVKSHLPSFNSSPKDPIHYSPFQKLNDSLSFFRNAGQAYAEDDKREILLSLVDDCNEIHTDFRQNFLDAIAKTNPAEGPLSHDWAIEHLLEAPEVAFKVAAKKAAQYFQYPPTEPSNLRSFLTFLNTKEKPTPPAQAPPAAGQPALPVQAPPAAPKPAGPNAQPPKSYSLIMDYVENALRYLQGNASISETLLIIMGSSFTALLKSDVTKGLISAQTDDTQALLNDIKNQTLEALANAKTSKDYKKVLEDFKRLWNENVHHLKSTKEADGLDKTLHELRQELNISKPKEDLEFDWKNQEAREKKIEAQFQELADNLRDQFTYQLVYEKILGKKSDSLFYTIKNLQKVQGNDKEKMKKVFINELRKAIDNADASWIRKAFAHLFVLFRIYTLIGRHTNSIVSKFYKNLNQQLEKIDKQDLVLRSSNCFSKYSSLLEAWAKLKNGGDKTPVIDELMKTQMYLSYGKESYTQSELYNNVATTFVDNYFDFYKGDKDQDDSFAASLNSKLNYIKGMSLTPYFNHALNPVSSSINYLFIGMKTLLVYLPMYIIISSLYYPTKLIEWITNSAIKFGFKTALKNFKTIDYVIESTRNGVYENNPYVHAITSFLADQLESLSQTLEAEKEPKDGDDEKPLVSEKTRGMIKKAAEGLIEVLNKDKFTTQDQLKNYLDHKGLSASAQDKIEQAVLPLVIESIIDLTAKASEEFINQEALQQPLSLLLDKLNQIITEKPEELDEEKRKIEILKYKAAEDKLKKYTDRLINLITKKAIDDAFDIEGQNQTKLINKTTKWIKDKTPDFLEKWNTALLTPARSGEEINIQDLDDLHEKSDIFLTELENKWDLLKHNSSSTGKELTRILLAIINPLKTLLKGTTADQGFFAFYKNSKLIDQTKQDLPHFKACQKAYESLAIEFPNLANNISNAKVLERISANSLYIKTTLSKIHTSQLSLLRNPKIYAPLITLLKSQRMQDREQEELIVKDTLLPTLSSLEHILKKDDQGKDLIDQLGLEKQAYINKNKGFLSSFSSNSNDPFIKNYNILLAQIKKIPSVKTRDTLISILNDIYKAKTADTSSTAIARFKNALNSTLKTEKDYLKALVGSITKIDEDFHKEINLICTKLEQDLTDNAAANALLIPQLQEAHDNVAVAVAALPNAATPAPVKTGLTAVVTDMGIDALKAGSHSMAYHLSKPKIDGLFDLLRNGSFSQFFVNHVVLMRLVK